MQAVVYKSFGEPSDVLETVDVPIPEPGPGQVRIEMILSPVHNSDRGIVRGTYGYRPELPAIGGIEAVGRIDAHGPGVTDPQVGQRVSVYVPQGAWAQYLLAEAAEVVPVPDSVDDATASQLFAMPMSALLLLEDLAIEPGQWIAINAANGAVGRVLNLLAQRRGVRVLNLVRSAAAAKSLAESGFGPVVDTGSQGWRERVATLTGGAPIVRAIDQVSGEASTDLLDLLAEDGELIAFGRMSGQPMALDMGPLMFKGLVIKGYWSARRLRQITDETRRRLLGELIALAADGALRLTIEASYPLGQAAEVVQDATRPGRTGKLALTASLPVDTTKARS